MRNRLLLVIAATVLAGVVLTLSLLVGGDGGRAGDPAAAPGSEGPADVPLWTGPGEGTPRGFESLERGGDVLGPGGASGGTYILDDGQTIVTVGHLNPQPGTTGVYNVTDPAVRRLVSDDRLLIIRANEGVIVAPEQTPRQGNFRGDVVVSLYELDPVRAASVGLREQDVLLRIFLDYVDFDIELGSIESTSEVLVTGPTLDFRGTGLSVVYNDLHDRLQALEILRGNRARFRLTSDLPGTPGSTEAESSADAATGEASAPTAEAASVDKPVASTSEPTPGAGAIASAPRPSGPPSAMANFYRARFENDVRITGSPEQVEMLGDYLDAVFALGSKKAGPVSEPAAGVPEGDAPPAPGNATASTAPPTPPAEAADDEAMTPSALVAYDLPPRPARQSMMTEQADDVVLQWKGRMVVEPEFVVPTDLASSDDVLLRLVGRPVRIATADAETVVAAEAEYQTGSRQIRARGSTAQPLVVDSPQLGRLEGRSIVLSPRLGTGSIQGPGVLTAHASQGADAAEPLTATWQDRLDLRFYQRPGEGATDLGDLQTASFVGPVKIVEPRFTLDASESLVIDLTPPGEQDAVLQRMQAAGAVALSARESDERWLDIAGDGLTIDFARAPDGQATPRRVVARDDVSARGPKMALQSQLLDVTLDPLATLTDDAAGAHEGAAADDAALVPLRDTPVQSLLAEQQVTVTLDDPGVTLTGDRLVAAAETGQMDLYGSIDRTVPARIEQRDGTIQGAHIILLDDAQQLQVPGPGSLTAALDAEDPTQQLAVVWSDRMRFDNLQNAASFEGAVTATTRGAEDVSTLTAHAMDLELARTSTPSADDEITAAGGPTDSRRLRRLVAHDRVSFTNSSYGGTSDQTLLTRLTLKGDELLVENPAGGNQAIQQVIVPGEGRMLIEDYRPDAPDAPQRDETAIALSGRGKTLFLWDQRLVLNAETSTAKFLGNVRVLHQPGDGMSDLDVLQLDANRMVADLQRTGGMGGVLSDQAGDVDLRAFEAQGNVQVIADDRRVLAERLQYDAEAGKIYLSAPRGRLVEVHSARSPMPLAAETITWDMKTGGFDLSDFRPGVAPLPPR